MSAAYRGRPRESCGRPSGWYFDHKTSLGLRSPSRRWRNSSAGSSRGTAWGAYIQADARQRMSDRTNRNFLVLDHKAWPNSCRLGCRRGLAFAHQRFGNQFRGDRCKAQARIARHSDPWGGAIATQHVHQASSVGFSQGILEICSITQPNSRRGFTQRPFPGTWSPVLARAVNGDKSH
jgi:hypothetical protein